MNADRLASAVAAEASVEMEKALECIKHCLNQLNDEQIWRRAQPGLNSIGNLILHLCGNVRQWIVSGVGGAMDTRNRPAEFADNGPIARQELLKRLEGVVTEAKQAMQGVTAEELQRARRIQGFEVTALAAIFNSVPHFRGHTQEIVHMTRLQLGDKYKFAWTPATKEQGA